MKGHSTTGIDTIHRGKYLFVVDVDMSIAIPELLKI